MLHKLYQDGTGTLSMNYIWLLKKVKKYVCVCVCVCGVCEISNGEAL